MSADSTQSKYDFADCSALYQEAVHSGEPTKLCPPSVRQSAAVSDTIALAIRHAQHDDAVELLYATITQRSTADDLITATVVDRRRVTLPGTPYTDLADSDTQGIPCTVREGATIRCHARHIGWVLDKAAVRPRLGWEERRSSMLEEYREREEREREFDAAKSECSFAKASAVEVDAAKVKEEQKQLQEESKQGSQQQNDAKKHKTVEDEATEDVFDYYV